MKKELTVEIGAEVRDVITGFKGIVTGRAQYLTGCNQALVSSKGDGTTRPAEWFDEVRLDVLKAPNAKLASRMELGGITQPGSDIPAPIR